VNSNEQEKRINKDNMVSIYAFFIYTKLH